MKICLINNLYRPYERGGSEKVVDFIYQGFLKKGLPVFVISGAPYFRQKTDERQGVYYLRSLFYHLGRWPLWSRFFWHLWNIFDFITVFKIWLILKKEKPDLVITNNLMGISFLLPRFLKALRIKHLHILHDVQLLHPSGLIIKGEEKKAETWAAHSYQALCRFLFAAPAVVISPSRWLMEEYVNRKFFEGSEKFVLTNPTPNFTDMKLSPERDDSKFSFLYVGQIEDHKGVPFLARTFVNFWEPFWTSSAEKKEKLVVELMIVGPGSKSADVEKIAYGDKRIKVFGAKTHSEVKEIMQSADCLIVPSLCYENSPTVIHEAAFLGLPVIAARIGGIAELVHETGGILFDPGSEEDLVEKMKYVLENRAHLRDIRIRERKFNRGDYIDDLIKLF